MRPGELPPDAVDPAAPPAKDPVTLYVKIRGTRPTEIQHAYCLCDRHAPADGYGRRGPGTYHDAIITRVTAPPPHAVCDHCEDEDGTGPL